MKMLFLVGFPFSPELRTIKKLEMIIQHFGKFCSFLNRESPYKSGLGKSLLHVFFYIFSYVKYSEVCAKVVRNCLKPEIRGDALKRGEESIIKVTKWEDGKPVGKSQVFAHW